MDNLLESVVNVLECASLEMKGVNLGTVADKDLSTKGWKHPSDVANSFRMQEEEKSTWLINHCL